jgi:hypothetical protein
MVASAVAAWTTQSEHAAKITQKKIVMRNSIFWDIMPCSPLKVNQHFGGTCCLHLQPLLATCFTFISCSAYSLALKLEVTCSSKMSVDFQLTTFQTIFQRIELFITTTMRTSNPIKIVVILFQALIVVLLVLPGVTSL